MREALITARLQHPGIVPVHEAGRWPSGDPYYSMKLVSGRTLKELVAERGELAARLALLPHVIAVAEAIGYAHSHTSSPAPSARQRHSRRLRRDGWSTGACQGSVGAPARAGARRLRVSVRDRGAPPRQHMASVYMLRIGAREPIDAPDVYSLGASSTSLARGSAHRQSAER